jgi:DNA polymerase III epsilon subunit-like protein
VSTRDKNDILAEDCSVVSSHPTVRGADVYFSADVETDGPIPGPYSILSFALVYAGRFDGSRFESPGKYDCTFYRELKPISETFDPEALQVNGLDRARLLQKGEPPERAMSDACLWVKEIANSERAVLVAYPLSFDWSWLYWYFVRFSSLGSPFGYSRCFDIKTAVAVKERIPISAAGRKQLRNGLRSDRPHSHNALDDAIEQAEIFSKVFRLGLGYGENSR